jgi:hypothetical protein
MKIEIDINCFELISNMKSASSIGSILDDLNPDEADILDYMPIEQLVQLAYDEDPGQVKENLIKILNISSTIEEAFRQYDFTHIIKTMSSINLIGLRRVINELGILKSTPLYKPIFETILKKTVKQQGFDHVMKIIKIVYKDTINILWEEK